MSANYSAQLSPIGSRPRCFQRRTHEASTFPLSPARVAQKFHFGILRIEVTRASRGLSAIAEVLVFISERERSRSLYTAARPSVVCNARAPYSGACNIRQFFYGIRYLGHPLTST